MLTDIAVLSEDARLALSRAALREAAQAIAERAVLLAQEMEEGSVADLGGPEALRLFAAVIRMFSQDALVPVGNA